MNILLIIILISVVVLAVLVSILLFKNRTNDISNMLNSTLKDQFLSFQSNIHKEINTTREEVTRSKDLISEHTLKTIETIKDLGGTMHKLVQQQEDAQKLGQSLKDILQAPKLRGSYGEVVLEEMLEKILPKGIWERQYTIDGRELVDAIVKIKGVILPIDAKFPRDDYIKYTEADSQEQKIAYWKAYENAVKNQIKSIKNKYIKPDKGTTDMAFMFIPSEAIYYETIAEKNYLNAPSKIYEFAQDNNVIPVSPNTLYAFLQVIIIGLKNIEIIKSAKKLQENLLTLERSFELFFKKHEEIGKNLEKANEAYRIGTSHIELYKRKLDNTLQLEDFREGNSTLSESALDDTNTITPKT